MGLCANDLISQRKKIVYCELGKVKKESKKKIYLENMCRPYQIRQGREQHHNKMDACISCSICVRERMCF